MRALAIRSEVIVFISRIWQTTCTAVRSGEEGFLIDSPVYPDELEALPSVLEQAGFPVSGLLVTHADWDHLLGRLAFPEASLGCGETTARRLSAELGEAQRRLRAFDEEHYVDGRGPLALAGVQSLPVPGRLAVGAAGRELELHPADGHTADGTCYSMPWLGVLVCGDYLSPVEIPMISDGGSLEQYLSTLERLRPLVQRADTVIPGHGGPLDRDGALGVLDEDLDYLGALRDSGADAPLPSGRRTATQRQIHARNVRRVRSGSARSAG
jgi:glyoxylase-like metal-dependent hydrolase (beta-lactamase superfamily II)